MAKIEIKLPEGWKGQVGEQYFEIESLDGTASVEVTVGDMPEDSAAPEQALINYIDMVGFDDDDPEDYSPIEKWDFNNRKAYGFDAYLEDESSIRVLCIEPKKGVLAVISIVGRSEQIVDETMHLLERVLRIRYI